MDELLTKMLNDDEFFITIKIRGKTSLKKFEIVGEMKSKKDKSKLVNNLRRKSLHTIEEDEVAV